jgi:hypothetical protein
MRIKTQRETFAYRLADMSTPFIIGDNPGGRGDSGGGGRGGGNKAEPSPAAPDASTPRGTLSGPWTSNPDKWNDMAEAENNRSGPKVPKRVIVPGAGGSSSGGGGGGSNTARPSGGGSSAVGAGGIMDVSRPLHDLIKSKYPDVEIGGYREDWAGEHARGSLDIMHPYNHGIDPNWVIEEGFKAGAPWAIWDNQMYYPGGRTAPYTLSPNQENNATQRHEDHVHIGPLM